MKLTDVSVKNLSVESGQKTFFDDGMCGFGVRVTPKSKTFVLIIHRHNQNKWETIGRYDPPHLTLAMARKKAGDRLAQIQLGQDHDTPTLSFPEAYELFLATFKAKNREKTVYEMERLVNRHLMPKLKRMPVAEITTQDVATIIEKLIPTHAECKALFTASRTLFRWMEGRRLIDTSPLSRLTAPTRVESRENVLSDVELGKVLSRAILEPTTYARIVELLIRTGQRVKQISHLRAEWIDYDRHTITWPREAMKGNREHTIPYTETVSAILNDLPRQGILFPARGKETPFNGFSKSKLAFDKKLEGVGPYYLHDFRRNFSSTCTSLQIDGVDALTVERILAHQIPGIAGVYNRFSYFEPMRRAFLAYDAHLSTLTDSA